MHIMPVTPALPNAVSKRDPNQPPAQAARDLLQTRDDLSEQPFGKLVSLFARCQTVPPAPTEQNTTVDPNLSDPST
jgi:hypothetical protein